MTLKSESSLNQKYARVFKGSFAVGLTFFLRFFDRIAIIPALIYLWGAHTVSNWLMIFAFFSHITLLLSGIPTQAANFITDKVLRKDWKAAQVLYSNAFFLLILISGLFIAFFALTQSLINWDRLIGLDAISSVESKWLILIFIFFYSFTAILSLPSQAYRAYGLFSRGQMIGNTRMIILFFLIILAIFSGFGPTIVAILYLATLLIDFSWLAWDFPRRCPQLKFNLDLLNTNELKAIGRNALIFTILMLGETLLLQTTLMITSHILGASAILGFIMMRTLINFLSMLSYEFGRVLWPEITLLNFAADKKSLHNLIIASFKITTAIGILLGAFLFFSASDLISCWSGLDNILPLDVAMILSIAVISKALYGGSSIFWLALNSLRFPAIAQLLGAIIAIIFTSLLTPILGLFGAALVFLVSDILFFTIPSLLCSAQILSLSLKTMARQLIFPGLPIFVFLLALSWLTHMPTLSTKWHRLAIETILYFPPAVSVIYWLLLGKSERLRLTRGIRILQPTLRNTVD